MAVEPTTGDLYYLYVNVEGILSFPTTMSLIRHSPVTGLETTVAEYPLANWSMIFADERFSR